MLKSSLGLLFAFSTMAGAVEKPYYFNVFTNLYNSDFAVFSLNKVFVPKETETNEFLVEYLLKYESRSQNGSLLFKEEHLSAMENLPPKEIAINGFVEKILNYNTTILASEINEAMRKVPMEVLSERGQGFLSITIYQLTNEQKIPLIELPRVGPQDLYKSPLGDNTNLYRKLEVRQRLYVARNDSSVTDIYLVPVGHLHYLPELFKNWNFSENKTPEWIRVKSVENEFQTFFGIDNDGHTIIAISDATYKAIYNVVSNNGFFTSVSAPRVEMSIDVGYPADEFSIHSFPGYRFFRSFKQIQQPEWQPPGSQHFDWTFRMALPLGDREYKTHQFFSAKLELATKPDPQDIGGWYDSTKATCKNAVKHCRFKDMKTGLQWTRHYDSTYSKIAREYCENLEIDGIKGWRLPTSEEFILALDDGMVEASEKVSQYHWLPLKKYWDDAGVLYTEMWSSSEWDDPNEKTKQPIAVDLGTKLRVKRRYTPQPNGRHHVCVHDQI